MSNIWSPEERARRLAAAPMPDRATQCGKWTGVVGCLLLVALGLGLLGALTVGAWRWALGG